MAPRKCPACGAAIGKLLHRQDFFALDEGSLFTGYDLLLCGSCGAAYASGIPEQSEFDAYYERMSKYEFGASDHKQSDIDLTRFRDVADLVVPFISKERKILDLGCATGGLLAELATRGYSNLLGLDPSPTCASATTRLYGIEARAGTFESLPEITPARDVVFLLGVLEHLEDVDRALRTIGSSLPDGGLLVIEVPDASRYADVESAPFQLFSIEHINYFSPKTLETLLARHGFSPLSSKQVERYLSPVAIEPTVSAIFVKREGTGSGSLPTKDDSTERALRAYIDRGHALDVAIFEKIAALDQSKEPIVVWGVGTHTQRLLATSRLREANILAYVDSNPKFQGKTLDSIRIVAPTAICDFPDETAIFVSSHVSEKAIVKTIRDSLLLSNRLITLYS